MLHLNTPRIQVEMTVLVVVRYENCAVWLPVDTALPIHNAKIMWGRWHRRWNANYSASINKLCLRRDAH